MSIDIKYNKNLTYKEVLQKLLKAVDSKESYFGGNSNSNFLMP